LFARQYSSQRGTVTVRPDGTTLPDPIAELLVAVHGTKMKALTIPGSENAKGRLTKPRRLFQQCVEHWREVTGRAVDDPQYFAGRGLLLQGLARLGNQPRVLHCNDRLGREVLQECNLLFGERPHLLAQGGDKAEERTILPQRRKQYGANIVIFDKSARYWK